MTVLPKTEKSLTQRRKGRQKKEPQRSQRAQREEEQGWWSRGDEEAEG
jgi:hypothetical protein